jgi:hypothetical protein
MVQIFCIASLLCGKTFVMQASVMQSKRVRRLQAARTGQAALPRIDAPVDSTGNGLGIVGDTFDEFDNFRALQR